MPENDAYVSSSEKAAFEENGYHVVRGALNPEEVRECRDAMNRVFQTPADHPYVSSLATCETPEELRDTLNPRALWNGFDLPLFDDTFYDLIFHPRLALTMDALIGPDLNFYETCFVTKPPCFPGTYRDWHQDSAYFDPQTNNRNAAVIVYLDEMDASSGATLLVPGSHRNGTLPHISPVEGVSSTHLEVADKRRYDTEGITFSFQPGDALFFLASVIHKAGGNSTDRSRTGLIYNYLRRDNLDLGKKNRSIANSVPVTRGGRIYTPGSRWAKK